MNPIELVWNDMKNYLYAEIKPNTKQEVINGIKAQSLIQSRSNNQDTR